MNQNVTLKSLMGTAVPETCRAVLYLCEYVYGDKDHDYELRVMSERMYDDIMDGLNAYASIPNPPSQLARGATHAELLVSLGELHRNMVDQEWLTELGDML